MDWKVMTFAANDLLAWIGLAFVIVLLSIVTAAIVAWIADKHGGSRW